MSRQYRVQGFFHRIARDVRDNRGIAFITAVLIIFAVGMMLFGFMFINQSEIGFAAVSRNSTQALGLADAGIQESFKRLSMFGGLPGATSFTNSLAIGFGGSGTVAYQAALQSNPAIFPILSTATFGGAKRVVRVFERAVFKTGLGNVIFGPQITFQGNAQPVVGDQYSQSGIAFAQYQKSPLCASGATATNLIAPQVMAGTTVGAGAGPNVTPPCGSPVNAGTYTTECASGSLSEVAPTLCPGGRAVSGANVLPVSWHPMTPIGMSVTDFTAVMTASSLPAPVSVTQATQNGVGVTYTSAGTYTPSYWTSVPTTNGKVMLITATQPFCVNSTLGTVALPFPGPGGSCGGGFHFYGNQVGGFGNTTRYLDWGLVADDLTQNSAAKFFQAPTCTTCNNGAPNGNQNGIRYVPLLPTVNVLAQACSQNLNPGINIFDQVNTGDGITCPNPPIQTVSSPSVTITGTKSNPESLVIDNAGNGTVQIFGDHPGGGVGCSANFDNYNWGVIMATGDLDLQGNLVFTGFIYTPGNVISHGTVVVRGGIYAANSQASSSQVNQVDSLGTVNFCTATAAALVLSPQFFTFTTLSWQDRPLLLP